MRVGSNTRRTSRRDFVRAVPIRPALLPALTPLRLQRPSLRPLRRRERALVVLVGPAGGARDPEGEFYADGALCKIVGRVCLRLRDELGPLYDDDRFAALFPAQGRPAEAPWRLALVTVLQ